MIKICEKFGNEFDLTFNASKTVCIYFPGKRRYRENPTTLYMNDKALSWVKSVKHPGNIVTWHLREVEEISKKRCDFIGRTNSLLANFKSIQKEILSSCHSVATCMDLKPGHLMPVISRVSVPHGAKRSVNCGVCQILPDLPLFPTLLMHPQ